MAYRPSGSSGRQEPQYTSLFDITSFTPREGIAGSEVLICVHIRQDLSAIARPNFFAVFDGIRTPVQLSSRTPYEQGFLMNFSVRVPTLESVMVDTLVELYFILEDSARNQLQVGDLGRFIYRMAPNQYPYESSLYEAGGSQGRPVPTSYVSTLLTQKYDISTLTNIFQDWPYRQGSGVQMRGSYLAVTGHHPSFPMSSSHERQMTSPYQFCNAEYMPVHPSYQSTSQHLPRESTSEQPSEAALSSSHHGQLMRMSSFPSARSTSQFEGFAQAESPSRSPQYGVRREVNLIGDLDSMMENWTRDERRAKRRLVEFERSQMGNKIDSTFKPITLDHRAPSSICVSCIWWEEKQDCFVTSVDTIYLLESLVAVRFTVEEKNRIRRNLEGFRPLTVAKLKPDSESFFKIIMNFPHPKPRNIEKDIKVFPWKILQIALRKIISKYPANYSPGPAPLQHMGSTSFGTTSFDQAATSSTSSSPSQQESAMHSFGTDRASSSGFAPSTSGPQMQMMPPAGMAYSTVPPGPYDPRVGADLRQMHQYWGESVGSSSNPSAGLPSGAAPAEHDSRLRQQYGQHHHPRHASDRSRRGRR